MSLEAQLQPQHVTDLQKNLSFFFFKKSVFLELLSFKPLCSSLPVFRPNMLHHISISEQSCECFQSCMNVLCCFLQECLALIRRLSEGEVASSELTHCLKEVLAENKVGTLINVGLEDAAQQ